MASPPPIWDIEIRREWVQRTLSMQERLLRFLMWAEGIVLGVSFVAFLVVLFLSGWEETGFVVSDAVLNFLGGAALTAVGGLTATAITTLFRSISLR